MKNNLINENSAYLRQHASNPVNWQTWKKETFDLAKELDRPIFLSSGYSSCYWCHVMEHECFSNLEISEILNNFFVPIKIDKEELPVVDEIYMDSLSALGRHGGWPLSMFLDTNLNAFYGGTYFPKIQFIEILGKIAEYWREDRTQLLEVGERVKKVISVDGFTESKLGVNFEGAIEDYKSKFDPVYGGFSKSPKFPPSVQLNFLITALSTGFDIENIVEKTLKNIIFGGLQDHTEGGFHRYSVDNAWNIPHFEKMLYDNAQITRNIIKLNQIQPNTVYEVAIENSLEYLKSQLSDGCFTSSIDAGEPGKEGEYYTFDESELEGVDNYIEGKIHLRFYDEKTYLDFQKSDQKRRLLQVRKTKEFPRKDLKVITSWNALAIKTFVCASRNNPEYLKIAESVFENLLKINYKDKLLRTENSNAVLEDYAYLISVSLDLYRLTLNKNYLDFAEAQTEVAVQEFWDEDLQVFLHSKSEELIIKKFELICNVLPCPNAVMLDCLRVINIFNTRYVRHEFDLNARFESARDYAYFMPTYMDSRLKTYYVIKLSRVNYQQLNQELPENDEVFYQIDDRLNDLLICEQDSCTSYSIEAAICHLKKKLNWK